jgi:metal-responsive CopG/Arc/MetJ family transcriptional regulator
MKNVQITVDETLLAAVDLVGKPLGLNRSQVVRKALKDWLRRQEIERFEQDWIAALQANPDDPDRAEAFLSAQAWSKK